MLTIYPYPHIGGISTIIQNYGSWLGSEATRIVSLCNLTPRYIKQILISGPALILNVFMRGLGAVWLHYSQILLFRVFLSKQSKLARVIYMAHDIPSLNAANSKSSKKILVVHDYYTPSLIASGALRFGGMFERFFRVVEASSYMKADAIITVDNRIRQYVLSFGTPKPKVFTVLNAPNTRNFRPYPERRAEFRHEFNLPGDLPVVLVPRRLVKKTGVEYAIRAAGKVYRQNSKFVLVVAGTGPEERRLRRLARVMGIANRVVFLGGVEQKTMWRLYNASDVIVIPSMRVGDVEEASSLSALEAMSCAKPVIASRIGGLAEIIKNRETGFLVTEKDPENLSKTIALLLRNKRLRTRIGLQARDFVIQHERRIRSRLIHLVDRTRKS